MNIFKKIWNFFKPEKNLYDIYDVYSILYETPNSIIYLLNHKKTNDPFICKYIHNEYYGYNELFNLQNFKHSKIIELIEQFTVQNKIGLIFNYYPLGDVFEYCNKNYPLSEENANRFFKEIMNCVKVCHSQNLVHLDIKLENFLIKSLNPLELIIIDLAYAKILISNNILENCDNSCGTKQYVAPELYNKKYGYCSDIWSLGVCLYMLITGKHLYKNNKLEIHLENCSVEVKNLILKMIHPTPNLRITLEDIEKDPWYNSFK